MQDHGSLWMDSVEAKITHHVLSKLLCPSRTVMSIYIIYFNMYVFCFSRVVHVFEPAKCRLSPTIAS